MDSTQRTILITGGIFGLAALGLASMSLLQPQAAETVVAPVQTVMKKVEHVLTATPMDFSDLVKWDFKADPAVSTEVLHQQTVRKIAYGRLSDVSVFETSSGVYSTDALEDSHVQYPGLHRLPRANEFTGGLAIWSEQFGWVLTQPYTAGSFMSVTPIEGGHIVTRGGDSCTVTSTTLSCS